MHGLLRFVMRAVKKQNSSAGSPSSGVRQAVANGPIPWIVVRSDSQPPGRRMRPPRGCQSCYRSRLRPHLFLTDRLHDLPHLHRIARGNFLEGYGQLIGRDTGEVLEHRPQLLQHLGLFGVGMATPQNTVQSCGVSLFTRGISRTLGIREKHYSHETLGDLHHSCMDPRDFACDLRLRLFWYETIFGDSGVQRHSRYPPNEKPAEITALATSTLIT